MRELPNALVLALPRLHLGVELVRELRLRRFRSDRSTCRSARMRFRRNEWARNLEKTRCCSAPAAVNALDAHDVTRVLVAGRTGRRRLRTDTLCSSLANVPALLAEGDARGTFAILVRALAVPTARVRGAAKASLLQRVVASLATLSSSWAIYSKDLSHRNRP